MERENTQLVKLRSLLEIARALTAEKDLDRLLSLILQEVTRVTEADRSSVFLVDRERRQLWSRIAQGLEIKEIRIPLASGIAGHVAITRKILNIPDAYQDPRFNSEVDKQTGYKTKTILCVPMMNREEEVIGVIEVLNKRDGEFLPEDEELLLAFAGQAAVAIENAFLYEEIERLFEGFIRASVYAIESRDPTTYGHSERVAVLTVGLAEAINRVERGPLSKVRFSPDMLKELRYAALLHDFGKIGVKESILVKANKLYEEELQLLLMRFKLIKRTLEAEYLRKKNEILESSKGANTHLIERLDQELIAKLSDIDSQLRFILECNKPAIIPEGGFECLKEIAIQTYPDLDGNPQPFLTPYEMENLFIPTGSLNTAERLEIESHVIHTIRFLERIPWTKNFKEISTIAGAHHEKLDGSGYPNRLRAPEIPTQSRMMTIADIYDALTASDRPYKRALPIDRSLNILASEAKEGKIDWDLFNLFIGAKVYNLVIRGS